MISQYSSNAAGGSEGDQSSGDMEDECCDEGTFVNDSRSMANPAVRLSSRALNNSKAKGGAALALGAQ